MTRLLQSMDQLSKIDILQIKEQRLHSQWKLVKVIGSTQQQQLLICQSFVTLQLEKLSLTMHILNMIWAL